MIIVYLDTQDSILLKSKDSSFILLYYILQQSDKETLVWYADKLHKDYLTQKVGCTLANLDKQIRSLKERDIISTLGKGKYKLNEKIFTI